MAKKVAKKVSARAVSKLDLKKPVKVGAAAKGRSQSDVFGTIAQHVGIHRRDVAAVFHVMGSMIKADLSKSGTGVFKVPGLIIFCSTISPMLLNCVPPPDDVTSIAPLVALAMRVSGVSTRDSSCVSVMI